jgi:hypothetical protein
VGIALSKPFAEAELPASDDQGSKSSPAINKLKLHVVLIGLLHRTEMQLLFGLEDAQF